MRVQRTNEDWGLDLQGHIMLKYRFIPTQRQPVHYLVGPAPSKDLSELCRVYQRNKSIFAAHGDVNGNEAKEVDKPLPNTILGYVPLQVENCLVPERIKICGRHLNIT
jgi:hypothetical protein